MASRAGSMGQVFTAVSGTEEMLGKFQYHHGHHHQTRGRDWEEIRMMTASTYFMLSLCQALVLSI